MQRSVDFLMKCVTLCLLLGVVRMSTASFSGSLVTPRMFTVMVDPEGGDWNTARQTCASVNMSLATVDRHASAFLVSQTLLRPFQLYAARHFWIGLYDENTRNQTSAIGEYRWMERCEPMSSEWMFWDTGQPRSMGNEHCVYASNSTLRWRTDKCSAKHQYLCQRREQTCHYNHTLPTCTLYITASKRQAVPNGSTADCFLKCDNTLVDDLPCWGFTMTSSGCVLHYQATQPNCGIIHYQSSALLRTCFQMFYVEGPFNTTPLSDDKDLPVVPLCDSQNAAVTETSAPSTSITQTTEQFLQTSTEDQTTTAQLTTPVSSTVFQTTEATEATTSSEEPSTVVPKAIPRVLKPPIVEVRMSSFASHQCPCNCDVTKRNKMSVLKAVEVTSQDLTVDIKTLSSTRRRKKSASDYRLSSKSIAYLGVSFVALAISVIILPDIVKIGCHLRYGVPVEERKPRRRACQIT